MAKRVKHLKEKDFDVSKHWLANYYKKHGIRYLQPKYRLSRPNTDDEHKAAQLIFVRGLVERMLDGKEIFYLDECTVSS